MRSHWEKVQNSFVPMQMPGSNDSEKGQAIPKALDSSSYYPPIPDYNYSQGLKQYPDNSNLNYAPLNESRNNYNNPYGDFNKYNNSYGYNENNNNNGQRGYHVVQPFDGVVEPNQSKNDSNSNYDPFEQFSKCFSEASSARNWCILNCLLWLLIIYVIFAKE